MNTVSDPNSLLKVNTFSPPPFITIPDEPRPLNKLTFAPRTTLLNPMRNVWTGTIRDHINRDP